MSRSLERCMALLACLSVAAAAIAVSGSSVNDEVDSKSDVCIIGAGASGLASALRLRQKGYKDVVIFERNAVPGGKAITLHVGPDNSPVYLAAIFGGTKASVNIVKLLESYQVPYPPFRSDAYAINAEVGAIIPTSGLLSNKTALAAAFVKYSALYAGVKQYLVPGYTKGFPKDLQQSYGSWVRANGLEALLPILYTLVTAYGYGSLDNVPAGYVISYIRADVLEAFLGTVPSTGFYTDYAMLWQRAADDLDHSGVKIKYSVDIISVKQSPDGKDSTIMYTTINGSASPSTHSCLRIIAAFPPNKASLAVFDLDSRQRAVFDRVRFIQYISGLIKFPNNTKNFGFYVRGLKVTVAPFTLSEPPGDGLPSLIVTYPYTPVAGVYNWIAGDTVIPDTTLAQQTVATLSKFNRPLNAPVNESTPLTQKDLIILKRWVYFAHFDVSTISAEVFSQLEALQGYRGTFWTSSVRSFETMESVVVSAYDIADRYF